MVKTITYLLSHDVDANNISGTAVRMDEIQRSISDYLKAKRVIILADTCHSGAIIEDTKNSKPVNSEVNNYFSQVEKSGHGIAMMLSSEGSQTSHEDPKNSPYQWNKHGAFTHFLLEGMREGKADNNNDGVVRVRELFEYSRKKVISNVKHVTGQLQTPTIKLVGAAGDFPLIVTGGESAKRHFEIGRELFRLGRMEDEPDLYLLAINHLDDAASLYEASDASNQEAEARRLSAIAWLALENFDLAAVAFSQIATHNQNSDTFRFFQVAAGLQSKTQSITEAAVSDLDLWRQNAPNNLHANYLSWMQEKLQQSEPSSRKAAILIGIDTYEDRTKNLKGCKNDAQRIGNLLNENFNFECAYLLDENATAEKIVREIERVRGAPNLEELIIFYSGRGSHKDGIALYCHEDDKHMESEKLHQLLMSPTCPTLLIQDGSPDQRFVELAESTTEYSAAISCSPDESAARTLGGYGLDYGDFSFELAKVMQDPLGVLNLKAHKIRLAVKKENLTTYIYPIWLGEVGSFFKRTRTVNPLESFSGTWNERISQLDGTQLRESLASRKSRPAFPPPLAQSLSRALVSKNEFESASQYSPSTFFDSIILDRYWQQEADIEYGLEDEYSDSPLGELNRLLNVKPNKRKDALVVGIAKYGDVRNIIDSIQRAPTTRAIPKLIEQIDIQPAKKGQSLLELGLCYGVVEEYTKALEALAKSHEISRQENSELTATISYHTGRLTCLATIASSRPVKTEKPAKQIATADFDLTSGVSHLTKAIKFFEDSLLETNLSLTEYDKKRIHKYIARAKYFRGLTVNLIVEQNLLDTKRDLTEYLEAGAPLGKQQLRNFPLGR